MIWAKRTGFLLLFPAVVWILTFTIFPLLQSLWFSFHNMRLGREARFTGFSNYSRIFRDDRVADVLWTSAFLSIGGLILTLVVGIGMAWLFNRDLPGIRFIRAALTMPLFTAPVTPTRAHLAPGFWYPRRRVFQSECLDRRQFSLSSFPTRRP